MLDLLHVYILTHDLQHLFDVTTTFVFSYLKESNKIRPKAKKICTGQGIYI